MNNPRRIFPRWFYTPPVGTVTLLAVMWFTFHNFDLWSTAHWWYRAFTLALALATGALTYLIVKSDMGSVPVRSRPKAIHYAYLVVHIDTRQSPPVAKFACIYSSRGQDLTMTGGEAHADVYRVSGDTYAEAANHMRRVAPLYFPWIEPLLVRTHRATPLKKRRTTTSCTTRRSTALGK